MHQLPLPNFDPSDFSVTFREFDDAWKFYEGLHDFDVGANQLSPGYLSGRVTDLITPGVKTEKHYHNFLLGIEGYSTK